MQQSSMAWSVRQEAGAARVFISGEMTENGDFGALLKQLPPGALVLDLVGVKRINSCGVREWVAFIAGLRGRELVLEHCSVSIVNQLNMISAFRGEARVRSVFAPY